MKEATYMKKMNLEVPESAEGLFLMTDDINKNIVEYANQNFK